tara:strand:- start:157 stop:516 length:360 start_codon:yes stop_codon:yes gene_type:complete
MINNLNYGEVFGSYGNDLYNLYMNREIQFKHFKFIHKTANRRGFTQYIKYFPDYELKDLVFKFYNIFNRNDKNEYSLVEWKPKPNYLKIVIPFKTQHTFGILYATLVYVTSHRGFPEYI